MIDIGLELEVGDGQAGFVKFLAGKINRCFGLFVIVHRGEQDARPIKPRASIAVLPLLSASSGVGVPIRSRGSTVVE